MSIDLTNGLTIDRAPQHYIIFGNFDSREYGMHLHERFAPTPEEKVNAITIPHRQGVVDFSNISGNRVYENREIVYTFYLPDVAQSNANTIQTAFENQIMREFDQTLQDSYDPEYHYIGKCSGVETTDDYAYRRLIIEITFTLYPFKVSNCPEGSDDWDTFHFDTDVFQDVKFSIGAGKTVNARLYNAGQSTRSPVITIDVTSGDLPDDGAYFHITKNGVTHSYAFGSIANSRFRLQLGVNDLTLTSTLTAVAWTVELTWHKELI